MGSGWGWAGGVSPAGNASMVALLREDAQGAYRAYFLDFSQPLADNPGYRAIADRLCGSG